MSALKCTDVSFVSFLEGCLRWDVSERFTPEDALQHAWIAADAANMSGSATPRDGGHRAPPTEHHGVPRRPIEMTQSYAPPAPQPHEDGFGAGGVVAGSHLPVIEHGAPAHGQRGFRGVEGQARGHR